MEDRGYVHVYTGNGKGKTTAAFGLAVRALCAGKKVYIGQFVKDMKYSETKLTEYFDSLTIEQLGKGCFVFEDPKEEDIIAAKKGLNKIYNILSKSNYEVVILDEATIAIYFKLFSSEDLIKTIDDRKKNIEVIITGRYAEQSLIDYADLVTEMKEIKHYYGEKGVLSREGIDK
ncbi:MAG: cob(I)yrinic acid a,c-diamide adenosyltransferase [Bacillota bacterium]|nr:cob(I)yrinic acid a,c-diamide adenosyltransferase [Bacillota bacterium]